LTQTNTQTDRPIYGEPPPPPPPPSPAELARRKRSVDFARRHVNGQQVDLALVPDELGFTCCVKLFEERARLAVAAEFLSSTTAEAKKTASALDEAQKAWTNASRALGEPRGRTRQTYIEAADAEDAFKAAVAAHREAGAEQRNARNAADRIGRIDKAIADYLKGDAIEAMSIVKDIGK